MTEVINLIWEYKHLFISPGDNITDKLNELGRDGWECFAIDSTNAGTQCILKRAIVDRRKAIEEGDWVTYIDANGKEHIREHLNFQLDFKPVVNDTWAKDNKMPTTRNYRIFEVAKELYIHSNRFTVNDSVIIATKLVDEVGIETE